MAKRKQPEPTPDVTDTPTKRQRKSKEPTLTSRVGDGPASNGTPRKHPTPPRRNRKSTTDLCVEEDEENEEGSATPKPNGRTLFSTPRKDKGKDKERTPSKSTKADRSAKRKSARLLAEEQDEEDWDGQGALAREILGEEEDNEDPIEQTVEVGVSTPTKTPGKRGRPKGAKNKRSPTPEGDIPPEERYFFQNRAGPPQVSNNKLHSLKLLTHEEYFDRISSHRDHEPEKAQLMKLHARSFPQWKFELTEGFGLCLYGFGSKRQLVNQFAEWLYKKSSRPPTIVIVNGYTPKLNVRGILNTIATAIVEEDENLRLVGQPHEMLDTLLSRLTDRPPRGQLVVMINSIDAQPLRRSSTQSVLARLAEHPLVHLLATADSPTFSVMWNSSLLDQFKFVFHDCTTFAPYTAEVSVVDEVHELLGRKRLRAGGKEGIGFVLKSLPENARNLYRLLLSEILGVLADGIDAPMLTDDDDEEGEDDSAPTSTRNPQKTSSRDAAEEVGIEYRTLYQKASEEFICSSSMNFQFLLKEFHDHQMITSRRDAGGVEVLGIPLGKEEMEAVLEELVL